MPANREDLAQLLGRSASFGNREVLPVLSIRYGDRTVTLAALDKDRLELLGKVRQGEPVELDVEIRAFQQLDGVSNRNFTRFKKGILRRLAKSFKGVPLLRDHDSGSLEARAGTVTASKAVPIEGGLAFDMSARITAPWAVEAVLAGNLDRFSIGWDFPGLDSLECSECKCEVFSECSHFPGDKLEDGGRVEFVFTEAEGVEVSAVSVPAVRGTGIEQVRSALNAALSRQPKGSRKAEDQDMESIAKALGLKKTAEEQTIIAAIGALEARAENAEKANTEAAGKLAEATKEAEELTAQIHELSAEGRARDVETLCAEYSDRFPVERNEAGEKVTSKLETQIRKMAEGDLEGARGMLEAMPSQRPELGADPAVTEVKRQPAKGPMPALTTVRGEIAKKQRSQLGLTEEQFNKYNSINGSETAHLRD